MITTTASEIEGLRAKIPSSECAGANCSPSCSAFELANKTSRSDHWPDAALPRTTSNAARTVAGPVPLIKIAGPGTFCRPGLIIEKPATGRGVNGPRRARWVVGSAEFNHCRLIVTDHIQCVGRVAEDEIVDVAADFFLRGKLAVVQAINRHKPRIVATGRS